MIINANQNENLALVDANFANETFPLVLVVTNKMPRNVVFPEVDGMVLRPVGGEQSSGRFKVANLDVLKRFISSAAQVAELNADPEAIELAKDEPLMQKTNRAAANKPRTETESKE